MTAKLLRKKFPAIQWDEPVEVIVDGKHRFACRYCAGLKGLRAADIDTFATDPAEVREHIKREHAE